MRRRIIDLLPPELRDELDRRLVDGRFSNYRGLAEWLREQGCQIAWQTVRAYGSKLERRLEVVRLATQQARAVVEAAEDDDEKVQEGMMRLVQQQMFALLVELTPDEAKGVNLPALGRSIADMGRAQVMYRMSLEDLRDRLAKRVAAAEKQVIDVVEADRGLSDKARDEIKRALMGIAE
jgi:hypothetical protein